MDAEIGGGIVEGIDVGQILGMLFHDLFRLFNGAPGGEVFHQIHHTLHNALEDRIDLLHRGGVVGQGIQILGNVDHGRVKDHAHHTHHNGKGGGDDLGRREGGTHQVDVREGPVHDQIHPVLDALHVGLGREEVVGVHAHHDHADDRPGIGDDFPQYTGHGSPGSEGHGPGPAGNLSHFFHRPARGHGNAPDGGLARHLCQFLGPGDDGLADAGFGGLGQDAHPGVTGKIGGGGHAVGRLPGVAVLNAPDGLEQADAGQGQPACGGGIADAPFQNRGPGVAFGVKGGAVELFGLGLAGFQDGLGLEQPFGVHGEAHPLRRIGNAEFLGLARGFRGHPFHGRAAHHLEADLVPVKDNGFGIQYPVLAGAGVLGIHLVGDRLHEAEVIPLHLHADGGGVGNAVGQGTGPGPDIDAGPHLLGHELVELLDFPGEDGVVQGRFHGLVQLEADGLGVDIHRRQFPAGNGAVPGVLALENAQPVGQFRVGFRKIPGVFPGCQVGGNAHPSGVMESVFFPHPCDLFIAGPVGIVRMEGQTELVHGLPVVEHHQAAAFLLGRGGPGQVKGFPLSRLAQIFHLHPGKAAEIPGPIVFQGRDITVPAFCQPRVLGEAQIQIPQESRIHLAQGIDHLRGPGFGDVHEGVHQLMGRLGGDPARHHLGEDV